jgi:squalene-associated FAD-dependent desaturase
VTVFEAAKIAGGRARRVEKDARSFDNGQHLLLGAYARSLAMIRSLYGERYREVIDQRPLALVAAPGNPEPVAVQAKNLPAPLHLIHAMMTARGLSVADKLAINLWCAKTLYGKFDEVAMSSQTVAQLIAEQPRRAKAWLWEPLCVAALNTPADRASARVFIEVLRRAFLGDASASDLAIPRVDLSALLPDPALAEVTRLGGVVRLGEPVNSIAVDGEHIRLSLRESEAAFTHVIVATGPQHIERLFSNNANLLGAIGDLISLSYEPISTLHYEFSAGIDPESYPMLMLDGEPGQWLFTHRLRNGGVRASLVISAHYRDPDSNESTDDLLRRGLAQLRKSFSVPNPVWQQLITEKRATYSCTPAQGARLRALPKSVGRLHFAGDWCVPELPATLESAVIAGENAATAVLKEIRG